MRDIDTLLKDLRRIANRYVISTMEIKDKEIIVDAIKTIEELRKENKSRN